MWGKRTAALLLCAMMVLMLIPSVAMAAAPLATITVLNSPAFERSGDLIGTALVKFKINNDEAEEINILQVVPIYVYNGIVVSNQLATDFNTQIPTTGITDDEGEIEIGINTSLQSGQQYSAQLKMYYNIGATSQVYEATSDTFKIYKTSPSTATPTPEPEEPGSETATDPTSALILSSVGEDGAVIPGPRGDAGDSIQLRLPIYNRSNSRLKEILVTPQISATLDSFPFVIEAVNYTCSLDTMRAGELKELVYNFKLSKDVTSGVKEVKFNAVYFNYAKQAYETATFSVFVTVVKGAAASMTDEDGVAITSTPKIIIESYSVEPANAEDAQTGRLFAGEQFALKLTVRNTSGEESVKNIQLTLSNEGGVILPADNGSNTLYIDRIGAGESVVKTIHLQSAPDAEAKAHSLSAKFSYESAKTLKTYEATETITLPVSQRMRVRVDDPVVYGDGTVDQSMPMYFSLYNMGKSSLYNCMVDVEGDGLRMEESFFGGNVGTGSTMRADFNIISSTAGQIEGKIVITYEDVYGEETRVEKPFTVNVMEAFSPEDMGGEEGVFKPGFEEELPPRTPIGLYIAIGAAVLVAAIVLLVVLKRKRRKRALEEL